jgi:hypothetical protein
VHLLTVTKCRRTLTRSSSSFTATSRPERVAQPVLFLSNLSFSLPGANTELAMEADRRSAVSSFYGRPRTSGDVLNVEYPTSYPQPDRARRDSSSTFFGNNGQSAALPPGAGYANRASYLDPGRQEPVKGLQDEEDLGTGNQDQGWDVYADFNNAGPRYSTAFGQTNAG